MSEKNNDETVGLGIFSPTPINASPDRVWIAMVDKMYNTEKYLPVKNVKTTDIVPGKHLYREMDLHGVHLKENIFFDPAEYRILATLEGLDQVHFNKYYPDTGLLEYWQENREGKRIQWDVPKSVVLEAMEKTKQLAEACK